MHVRIIWSLPFLHHKKSRLAEGDRDGVALGKRTKAAPLPRMSNLRQNLPAAAQHLPNVGVHRFQADIEDVEFRHKLKEVIFGYVSKDKTYGASSLEELIVYQTLGA